MSAASGRELLSIGAYRTALAMDGIGDWNELSTWEVWDGLIWGPASAPPDRNNDVFIEKDKEVRLIQAEEVGNLYIYGRDSTDSPPGKKLNLQIFDLNVFGALICFRGINGNYSLQNLTSGITDWIYPETGNIVFKGSTRTIVDRASWSANNGRSSYGVIFNPDLSDTLFVNAAFKANRFTIRSGTVFQQVNYAGTPATSTFSFNTMSEYGDEAYGDFIIEPGATLISEGTKDFNQIVRRSNGKPASRFELMEGGNLILLGQEPVIDAENMLLNGNVYYSGTSGNQQFISGSMAGVTAPFTYNHLFFDGNAAKDLPDSLELKGDFTFLGGGAINSTAAAVHFTGTGDQEVKNMALDLKEVDIDKPSGVLILEEDLTVNDQFIMTAGEVDFRNNQLHINGGYYYASGSWNNLSELWYQNIPTILSPSNSTFPFVDAYLGGVRKIVLSGTQSSPGTELNIMYHQLPGVNWDPDFNDYDNAPILYKLNSYFTFTLRDYAPADSLEIFIAADNLIVVDDGHLRIVGDDAAAPGNHLAGLDNMAGRAIALDQLHGQTLTIGSTGIASILPVVWLSYSAEALTTGNLIRWSTAKEVGNLKFLIMKSTVDGHPIKVVGEKLGFGNTNAIQHYSFLDKSINQTDKVYYRLKQVDQDGAHDFSPVFSLMLVHQGNKVSIFPNPYLDNSVEPKLIIPPAKKKLASEISVRDVAGKSMLQESGELHNTSKKITSRLKEMTPGAYFIIIATKGEKQVIKWTKGF